MGTGASSSYIDKASDAELQGILEALPDLARLRPQLRPQLLKALSSVATERTQEKKEKKLRVASELVPVTIRCAATGRVVTSSLERSQTLLAVRDLAAKEFNLQLADGPQLLLSARGAVGRAFTELQLQSSLEDLRCEENTFLIQGVTALTEELRSFWVKKVLNWTALSNAPYEVQADRAVVLAAVKVNGYALRFASAALRNDKALVLVAVAQKGRALRFASEALRRDRQVLRQAALADGAAMAFAEAFRDDAALIRDAVLQGKLHQREALRYASDELRGSAGFVLELVEAAKDFWLFSVATETLKRSPGFRDRCLASSKESLKTSKT